MYGKTHSVSLCLFDLDRETELKTILDDTFCRICEQRLQEKVQANEMVKEFDMSFSNHYIASGTHNNPVVSRLCENNLMKEDVFYDGIGR